MTAPSVSEPLDDHSFSTMPMRSLGMYLDGEPQQNQHDEQHNANSNRQRIHRRSFSEGSRIETRRQRSLFGPFSQA